MLSQKVRYLVDGGPIVWVRQSRFEEKVMICVMSVHFRLFGSSRSTGMEECLKESLDCEKKGNVRNIQCLRGWRKK